MTTLCTQETIEVLQHFGPNAPQMLNDYSCKLEDVALACIEKVAELKRELAALKGEEADLRPEYGVVSYLQTLKSELLKK